MSEVPAMGPHELKCVLSDSLRTIKYHAYHVCAGVRCHFFFFVSITSCEAHFSNFTLFFKFQTDKASLLAEVVHHVKELKRHAADVAPLDPTASNSAICQFPGETDEVKLDRDRQSSLIRASVCCDDRPELLSDLNGAIRSLGLRAVKAEIATLGGRTKSIFLIEGGGGGEEDLSSIRRALKTAVEKRATAAGGGSNPVSPENKRLRLSRQPNHHGFQWGKKQM